MPVDIPIKIAGLESGDRRQLLVGSAFFERSEDGDRLQLEGCLRCAIHILLGDCTSLNKLVKLPDGLSTYLHTVLQIHPMV
ncbi:MAG: hypothetical protein J07HN4v3_00700 [Halonotius sp. J07HN4]|nr:MAG: hypothetical protein J07HN4v3_00700 [Halonotius sp. J07HN4]